jgi:hypothetical protein
MQQCGLCGQLLLLLAVILSVRGFPSGAPARMDGFYGSIRLDHWKARLELRQIQECISEARIPLFLVWYY